eukprot:CAMPEP_0118689840 /NCGR_PEP_ID=MMETSP0800-20121206/9720_1 /TAXON_ID=210618 ORGANISM="Striatella unipunctata, Strain CCMP2910" /NCGR_SAMPLE_ID=MMETSP0800 /ASSEMBLY_ACC=CAM_ASM_000638 /LENGTH=369 /DNA_ID=CAMNT_0006587297 /DNA_START=136 /DNA_END=1246 /DNA_ORIENTATION=+
MDATSSLTSSGAPQNSSFFYQYARYSAKPTIGEDVLSEEIGENAEAVDDVPKEPSQESMAISPISYTEIPKNGLEMLQPGYTAGRALGTLQKKGAGGVSISEEEFRGLIGATTPNSPKDAKIIYTALRDFRRINNFVLDVEIAKLAMEHMRISMSEEGTENQSVSAILFVARSLLDQTSGLYCATPVEVIDGILFDLLEATKREGIRVEEEYSEEGVDSDEAVKESADDDSEELSLANEVADTARSIIIMMVSRATPKKLRKKQKRSLTKYMRTPLGPTTHTIQLAVDICLQIGSFRTAERIVNRCIRTKFQPGEETIAQVAQYATNISDLEDSETEDSSSDLDETESVGSDEASTEGDSAEPTSDSRS